MAGFDDLLNKQASADWMSDPVDLVRPSPKSPTIIGGDPVDTNVTPLPKPVDKVALPTNWNTDGFATPGYTAQTFGNALSGWEASKWNDPTHQTPKYVIGRILSNYPDNPAGLSAAIADIQRAYPGSTLLDGGRSGKINVPGVGVVDVGVSFGSGGGRGWAWQPDDGSSTNPFLAQLSQPQNVMASPQTQAGAPVPSMPGYVYNAYGGIEPGGAGNPVPGMPGAYYGPDGYTLVGNTTVGTSQSATAGSPGAVASGTGTDYGAGLDDPATQNLMALLTQRIQQLWAPITDPSQAQATAALQSRIGELSSPLQTPQGVSDFQTQIQNILAQLTSQPSVDPSQTAAMDAIRQRMADLGIALPTPQGTTDFQQVLKDVMTQLQGPTFSEPALANMKARAFDTLNTQEQAEIDNTVRALAQRGVAPTSGLVEHSVQQVRAKYAALKAQQQQQLNQYEIDTATQRRDQLLSAAQTGSNLALTQQQQEEARKNAVVDLATQLVTLARQGTQDLNQRNAQILTTAQAGANVGQTQQANDEARKNAVVSLSQQLVDLARTARGEQSANQDKAISFAGVPVDITERRVNNAVNASSGQATNPSNVVQTISNLLSGLNNQTNANSAASSNYLQNLTQYLSQIDWSKVFG